MEVSTLTSVERFSRLRNDAKFINGFSATLRDRAMMNKLLDLKKTNANLKDLTRKRRVGGERLTAAACVLFATPDPVTTISSLPLFAIAQLVKSKEKQSDIGRVLGKARSEINELVSFSSCL